MGEKYEDGNTSASENSLTEKDKKLNALSSELFDVTRDLSIQAINTIDTADYEIPYQHAKVNEESLAKLKLQNQKLQELIFKIEFYLKYIAWRKPLNLVTVGLS